MPEEFAEQREQYQYYRKRVQEHQHGYGVGYNVAQSEVGEYERKRAENYCPSSVIRSFSEQRCKRFRTACYKSDRRFQTGKGDCRGKNDKSRKTEIVLGYLRKCDAAVFACRKCAAALCADNGDRNIYPRHEKTTENARFDRIGSNRSRFGDAEAFDNVDNDYAERKACKRVHGVVSVKKARKKRLINVIAFGRDGRYRRCGIDKRNNDKYSEEYKKTRVEYFSDPSQYLAGKK